MKAERYFLDVNVIFYAAGRTSDFKEACVKVLDRIRAGRLWVAIDTEIVQEILYRYHRIGLYEEAVKLAWYLLKLKPKVLPVSLRDVESSIQLYHKYSVKGVPPRDTIHVAVMLNNGIKKIVSVDKHFGKVITEVERVHPKEIV